MKSLLKYFVKGNNGKILGTIRISDTMATWRVSSIPRRKLN